MVFGQHLSLEGDLPFRPTRLDVAARILAGYGLAIDVQNAVFDLHFVPRQADHALHIQSCVVTRQFENYYIATPRFASFKCAHDGEKTISDEECRLH